MSSAPSLALRSLLTGVLRETGLQAPLQRLSGATSPVRAMAVAAAAKRLSGGTVLLIVPTDADMLDVNRVVGCADEPARLMDQIGRVDAHMNTFGNTATLQCMPMREWIFKTVST